MHDFSRLKQMLGGEIEEYAKKGRLGGGDMSALNLMADTYKNLCKIEKYEGEGGSQRSMYGSYEGGDSGRHWVRGHYSRDGGSYDGGSYNGSYGESSYEGRMGYSRHEAKDRMMDQLGEMMRDADPKTREALKHCMRQIENG